MKSQLAVLQHVRRRKACKYDCLGLGEAETNYLMAPTFGKCFTFCCAKTSPEGKACHVILFFYPYPKWNRKMRRKKWIIDARTYND
ncbi:hypothetical protein YC2023_022928 [Brassica napus]